MLKHGEPHNSSTTKNDISGYLKKNSNVGWVVQISVPYRHHNTLKIQSHNRCLKDLSFLKI